MEWLTPTFVAKVVLGLVFLVLFFVLARRIAVRLGMTSLLRSGNTNAAAHTTSTTTSSSTTSHPANWGWVSTLLKSLAILAGIALVVWGVIWLWGLSEPIRLSKVPILSAEKRARAHGYTYVPRQQGDIIREVVPAAKVPVCAQNSAKTYTLSENDWTRFDIPAGCQPVIDPDYKLGEYLMQYLDITTGEWQPISENGIGQGKAIRLRKQVSSEPCTITVQVWFQSPAV